MSFLPVNCCCATSDFKCAFAMFLIYNTPGNTDDVPAMHIARSQLCLQAPLVPHNFKGDA